MSYKTILVQLNDHRRTEQLLESTCFLAEKFASHVIGLHLRTGNSASPSANPGMAGMTFAAGPEETDDIAAAFAKMTDNRPFTAQWVTVERLGFDIAEPVIRHARYADLIVAGQPDPDWPFSPMLDFPERLVLETGRPVLVIPYAGRYPEIGRNSVIAWKPTRESARAVFDALPLLKSSTSVQILEVNEGAARTAADTMIAAALAAHGIKTTQRTSGVSGISAGDEILSRLADASADLLVMGAYGHSRMREVVFGGVTRHIARHMTAPTLWSH